MGEGDNGSAKVTWLTPYWVAYNQAYGMDPANSVGGIFARFLAPLEKQRGPEATATAFSSYCQTTPAEYFSMKRFAETAPRWFGTAAPKRGPLDQAPDEDLDAYMRRLAADPHPDPRARR